MLTRAEPYPVVPACAVVGLPRSSYYHEPRHGDDQVLRTAMAAIVREFPTYGSRRVAAQLRRAPYGRVVNRKRVQRLMRELGLQRPVKRHTCRTTDSRHPFPRYPNLVQDLELGHPDQVWVADITYIRLRQEFVYLAVIMDVYTRAIRGWHLSRWLDQALTVTALHRALRDRVPTIHHSDQGIQYASGAYVELLRAYHIQISMAQQGTPEENGYAERLIRTIKEEEVDLAEYVDFADALAQIGHFIEEVYQQKRIHSALGYLTPAEFEAAWWERQAEVDVLPKPGLKSVQL